jgi:methylenetetrahydrofolate dehydrogenase (NADP+)/methenyltetrahydrofolate cyclohydrolase
MTEITDSNIIKGKALAQRIRNEIAIEVTELKAKGILPHLAAVLVGEDGASQTYVNMKVKACAEAGIKSSLYRLDSDVSESDLLNLIQDLNDDTDVDGILVQLPLPDHVNVNTIIECIKPEKDVDCFHPINVGRMNMGLPAFISATPYGILLMLEELKIETKGKHCVIVGRSNIVGSPMATLMKRNAYPGNCTTTLCHRYTKDLASFTKQADILIVATGLPGMIKSTMVKEGAVVIDVGITRVEDASKKSGYRLVGDVAFDEVAPKCSFITPVPGGVGPLTITGLLKNTLLSAKKVIYKD